MQRNPRGVRATAAGDALIRHARLILGQVEQMRGELRRFGSGLKGRLRLLSNTAAMVGFLPAQLRQFLVAHPALSIDLEEHPSAYIVQALVDRRADLGIVADTADLDLLQTHPIFSDQLVVVTSAAHRLAGQSSVSFADVLDEAVVGMADAALEIYLGERASRLGRKIEYRIKLRSAEHLALHVEAGVGISILPRSLAHALHHDLAVLPLAEPWATRQLYLCARDFHQLPPHALLLVEQLLLLPRA